MISEAYAVLSDDRERYLHLSLLCQVILLISSQESVRPHVAPAEIERPSSHRLKISSTPSRSACYIRLGIFSAASRISTTEAASRLTPSSGVTT